MMGEEKGAIPEEQVDAARRLAQVNKGWNVRRCLRELHKPLRFFHPF